MKKYVIFCGVLAGLLVGSAQAQERYKVDEKYNNLGGVVTEKTIGALVDRVEEKVEDVNVRMQSCSEAIAFYGISHPNVTEEDCFAMPVCDPATQKLIYNGSAFVCAADNASPPPPPPLPVGCVADWNQDGNCDEWEWDNDNGGNGDGGDGCFPAGVPITMADGSLVAVELVRVGDMVKTPQGATRVTQVFHTEDDGLPLAVINNRLVATSKHPIVTTKGLRRAGKYAPTGTPLQVGDMMVVDGGVEEVHSITYQPRPKGSITYNFDLAEGDYFFAQNVLVDDFVTSQK